MANLEMTKEEKKAFGMAKLLAFLIPIVGYIMALVYIAKGEGSKAAGVAVWATVSWVIGIIFMVVIMAAASGI
jgi:hypothetical protein